jgi:hypothetical protein
MWAMILAHRSAAVFMLSYTALSVVLAVYCGARRGSDSVSRALLWGQLQVSRSSAGPKEHPGRTADSVLCTHTCELHQAAEV